MSDRLGNNKVASRYAKALFESTLPLGQIDAVARDLSEMDQVFTSVPALKSSCNGKWKNQCWVGKKFTIPN